jgi:hypothetical protein
MPRVRGGPYGGILRNSHRRTASSWTARRIRLVNRRGIRWGPSCVSCVSNRAVAVGVGPAGALQHGLPEQNRDWEETLHHEAVQAQAVQE